MNIVIDRIITKMINVLMMIFVLGALAVFPQDSNKESQSYQEKLVRVGGIDLHYLDFGGSGVPMIFLQSFHGDAREWVDYDSIGFAPRFAKSNRVFAITRRGWGKSTDPYWGFDVATQADDVIGFMNALGINKAVLLGRIPANMDMTWIAEHHPERLAGLVYFGNPYIYPDIADPEVRTYVEMVATQSCDLGKDAVRKTLPRSTWRPHFMSNPDSRLQTPALRFAMKGELERQYGRDINFFGALVRMAKSPEFKTCDSEAQKYFIALAKDTGLQSRLESALKKADKTFEFNKAISRAFGQKLKTVVETDDRSKLETDEDFDRYFREFLSNFYYKEIVSFLATLK